MTNNDIYISTNIDDWDWDNEYYLLDTETITEIINSTTHEFEIDYGISIIPTSRTNNLVKNGYKRAGNIFYNNTLITETQINMINQALNTAFFEMFKILKDRQTELESE